jgi:hypothetical protein
MVRAALYARVSTHAGQDPEVQLLEPLTPTSTYYSA